MPKVVEFKERKFSISDKVKKKKYSLQFLPEALEPISTETYIQYKNARIKTAYIIDIIHNLLLKYYFKKDNNFNLSSIILKEKYGDKYNYYISYLVDNDIISLVRNHQKGKNARVYSINKHIINGNINRYKNADRVLLKKYRAAICNIDNNQTNNIDTNIRKKLINDLFHVDIDISKSIFYLDNTSQDNDIYNKNKYSVECINDSHIFYHFCDYGRLHTNFTILKSFIRKNCLLIDGKETFEKDISNSQPLFLCKLIYENDIHIVDRKEFDLFKTLTLNGNFYKYIMDRFPIYSEKKLAKEMVYKVFFGKNYKNKDSDNFLKLFPTIYNFIRLYKIEMGDYRSLSHYLQRSESNFIFKQVVKTIMDLYPEIKVITIHDSIIVPIQYREIIEVIFDKKIKEEFYFF